MKNICILILALMLAGCNVTAFNVFEYDPFMAMQPTSTQAATVTAPAFQVGMPGTPTPTPENSLQLKRVCTVTAAQSLNLRSGPGVGYQVISWLEAGETLTRLPTASNDAFDTVKEAKNASFDAPTPPAGSWWKVTTRDGRTGWIHSEYCQ